jgi:para-aminobenzoate synthetase component I
MLNSIPLDYTENGAKYFAAIADLPWAIWLDSAGMGEYDILCAQPVTTLTTYGDRTEISHSGKTWNSAEDPFNLVRKQLRGKAVPQSGIPFAGGAVGYWGYDLVHRLMNVPATAKKTGRVADMAVGIYDWAIVLDHKRKVAQLVSRHLDHGTVRVLPGILARLQNNSMEPPSNFQVHGNVKSDLSRTEYRVAFNTVQKYLEAGDCYQVNLAQSYNAYATGDAIKAYLELRKLSPAPYSAFLNLPQLQILCASPERFIRSSEGRVETRPIKGTRPRMKDKQKDRQIKQELQSSPKDRSENLMIVDLLRNDLGKSCLPGSIKAPEMFGVESYEQVHHLVSTVTGQLAHGEDALALLRNCFPGGSITGAPKQRAMEIIDELEPCRRGIYCGSIGYIGDDGNMDSNIVIRTLTYSEGELRFWAGGGIVADSNEEDEYQETLDKAKAIMQVLRKFGSASAPQNPVITSI